MFYSKSGSQGYSFGLTKHRDKDSCLIHGCTNLVEPPPAPEWPKVPLVPGQLRTDHGASVQQFVLAGVPPSSASKGDN